MTGGRKPPVDSDSEAEKGRGGAGHKVGPTKKKGGSSTSSFSATNLLPPVRRDIDGLMPIETRKCTVPGCDSSGHLGELLVTETR